MFEIKFVDLALNFIFLFIFWTLPGVIGPKFFSFDKLGVDDRDNCYPVKIRPFGFSFGS